MEMPAAVVWKDGRPVESTVGSGQFGTPLRRMHRADAVAYDGAANPEKHDQHVPRLRVLASAAAATAA